MEHPTRITILVNQVPHHLESDEVTPELLRTFAGLPADYEVWQVVGSPDPEGQLPANDVQVTGPIHVKSGDRFRVVPPGTFGSAPALAGTLADEVAQIINQGQVLQVAEEPDWIILVFSEWRLPSGYSKPQTRLLLRLPRSYPFGKPDMFWTDSDLLLASGQPPRQTSRESILGEDWLRFSWHAQKWDPSMDNLRSYLGFVDDGLSKARF
jgi:hypothetical protein